MSIFSTSTSIHFACFRNEFIHTYKHKTKTKINGTWKMIIKDLPEVISFNKKLALKTRLFVKIYVKRYSRVC